MTIDRGLPLAGTPASALLQVSEQLITYLEKVRSCILGREIGDASALPVAEPPCEVLTDVLVRNADVVVETVDLTLKLLVTLRPYADVPLGDGSAGPASSSVLSKLSPREHQVLTEMARGLTHHQIARVMGISRHTVDTYVKRIKTKLELDTSAELIRAALSAWPFRECACPRPDPVRQECS